jgi:hypothetical protein
MPRGKKTPTESPEKRSRLKGGFAVAEQSETTTGDTLMLLAKDMNTSLEAETKLRSLVTEQGEAALKKTFVILQIKRAGIQPKVQQVTKVTF